MNAEDTKRIAEIQSSLTTAAIGIRDIADDIMGLADVAQSIRVRHALEKDKQKGDPPQ